MPTNTANFGLLKPLVNNATDQDLWGGYLNDDMDEIDGLLETSLNWTPSAKTANFSVTAPTTGSATTGSAKVNYLCDATGGAITASLPAAAGCSGMTVAFKKTDASANVVTIQGNGAETIDGSNTYALSAQYLSIVIASDGTKWHIVAEVPSSPITIKTVKKQIFTASGTYTPSTGMLYCIVEMLGAGGGGGSTNSASGATSGGGGAGEYGINWFSASDVGASQTITIGSGGSGGTLGGGGSAGGNTIFGGTTVHGGSGGSIVGVTDSEGGAGGSGGNAQLSIPGAPGGLGFCISGSGFSGAGASSQYGAGGKSRGSATSPGYAASGYGAGGGGTVVVVGGTGGAGSGGLVIITEYCSQ